MSLYWQAMLLILPVFVFSFSHMPAVSLGADGLETAREQNIPVLSYLANETNATFLAVLVWSGHNHYERIFLANARRLDDTIRVMVRIYYSTVYGSTCEYAEELASFLGVTAQPIPSSPPAVDGPVVVLSPIHGPSHAGAKFVKTLPSDVPVALVTTCMSTNASETDPARSLLGGRADSVERFYLPGRLNYSEMSVKHKMLMRGLVTALNAKGNLSPSEQDTVDIHGKDTDRVDFRLLDPVVAWVRGQTNT